MDCFTPIKFFMLVFCFLGSSFCDTQDAPTQRYILSTNGANSLTPPCPVGFYASSLACTPCPAGMTSPASSVSNASCFIGMTALTGATCVSTVLGKPSMSTASDSVGQPGAIVIWNQLVVFSSSNLIKMIQASGALQILVGGGSLFFDYGIATTYAQGGSWDMIPSHVDQNKLYLIIGTTIVSYKDGYLTRISGNARLSGTVNAGAGTGDNGPALFATFYRPFSIVVDEQDNIYVADDGNPWGGGTPLGVLRRIVKSTGIISQLVANLDLPWGMDFGPDRHLYILFTGGYGSVQRVDQLNIANVSSITLSKVFGDNYQRPSLENTNEDGSGMGGPVALATYNSPRDLLFSPNGDMIIADGGAGALRRVHYNSTHPKGNFSSAIITAYVGCCGGRSSSGDGGPAVNATLNNFYRFSIGSNGDVYVADTDNSAIRYISPSGIIRTFAGSAKIIPPRTLPFTYAVLNSVGGISLGPTGLLYIVDSNDHVLRTMNFSSGLVTQIAGQMGKSGFSGDGEAEKTSTFYNPQKILTLSNGDVIVSDSRNNRVRYINITSGIINTIAGGGLLSAVNGNRANEILLDFPNNIALDKNNNVVFSGSWDNKIYKIQNERIFHIGGTSEAQCAVTPFSYDGRLATNSTVCYPGAIVFDKSDNLILSNIHEHTILFFNYSTGLRYTLAGQRGVSGFFGDGGLAISAHLNSPNGLAYHSTTGNIYIADTGNHAIRVILSESGIIMLVAGSPKGDKGMADNVDSLLTFFNNPVDITFSPEGSLFVADRDNSAIRQLPFSSPTVCPAGFFCSCGFNLVPCVNVSTFCPQNSKAPIPVSPGFYSISENPLEMVGDATIMYISQKMCPLGYFCSQGLAIPCRGGTYGVAVLQSDAASCILCEVGTYLAESGRFIKNNTSPCLPCPPGSGLNSTGGRFCPFCKPGFHSKGSLCFPCPAGTTSSYGAVECFLPRAIDRSNTLRDVYTYSRILPVDSGNVDSTGPVYWALAPFLFINVLTLLAFFYSTKFPNSTPLVQEMLKKLDMFDLHPPKVVGGSPHKLPTMLGGFFSLSGVTTIIFLAYSTVIQFYTSNIQLQKGQLSVNSLILSSFIDLPLISSAIISPPPIMTVSQGFRIEVTSMGKFCNNVTSNVEGLLSGNMTYIMLASENGGFTHRFDCVKCIVTSLSLFVAIFPSSCQNFLVRVSAIDVGGGATVSELVASNNGIKTLVSTITAEIPLQIEILQDNIAGEPRASDGLIVQGRSALGYKVGQPQNFIVNTDGSVDDRSGSVTLLLNLQLQNAYTTYTFVPLMTLLTLVSTMAAWLGIFPFFGYAKSVTSKARKTTSSVFTRFSLQPVKRSAETVQEHVIMDSSTRTPQDTGDFLDGQDEKSHSNDDFQQNDLQIFPPREPFDIVLESNAENSQKHSNS